MAPIARSGEAQELRRLIPLNTLPVERFEQLCAEIAIEVAPKGASLFRQGDADPQFYFVLSGTVSLQAGDIELDSIKGGSDAARFSLAHQIPRKVSAFAKDRIRYVRIHPDRVKALRDRVEPPPQPGGFDNKRERDETSILLRSPLFRRLPSVNLQTLLRRAEEIEVRAGEVIFRQDDPGGFFYIIKQGRCVLSRKPDRLAKDIVLARLKPGDAFGEDALLVEGPRAFGATMSADGRLLRLGKTDFLRLVRDPLITRLSAPEARAMANDGAVWLDVRMADAFSRCHPAGSLNHPFVLLPMTVRKLDRHSRHILVCDTGLLSEAAVFLLLRYGRQAYVLKGGIASLPREQLVAAPDFVPGRAAVEVHSPKTAAEDAASKRTRHSVGFQPAGRETGDCAPDASVEAVASGGAVNGARAEGDSRAETVNPRAKDGGTEHKLEQARQRAGRLKASLEGFYGYQERMQRGGRADTGAMRRDLLTAEAAEALHAQLRTVREQAVGDISIMESRLREADAERDRLRMELAVLRAHSAVLERYGSMEDRGRDSARRNAFGQWVWPFAVGLLSAAVALVGVLGSERGRGGLRSLLDAAESAIAKAWN